jgi:hypothetical protein
VKTLIRTLSAETLKLKRTLALWLALIMPLTIVAMQVGLFYRNGSSGIPAGESAWVWYGQLNMVFWGLLMLPLFVTLETALVGNMEHTSDHWKHLNALPVPRGIIYAAKQFSGMALVALSSVALVFFSVAGGLLLNLLRPGMGLDGAIPWARFFAFAAMTYVGAWLIISIQTWISLRWKSFVVACAAGIGLTVAGVFIIHADWGSFWPWALPGGIANEFNESVLHLPQLLFGGLGGLLAALLGGWDVTRQDVL